MQTGDTGDMRKESIKITFGGTLLQRLQNECDRLGIEKSALIAVAVDSYLRQNSPIQIPPVDATGKASEADTRTK